MAVAATQCCRRALNVTNHEEAVICGFDVATAETVGAGDTINVASYTAFSQGLSPRERSIFAKAAAVPSILAHGPQDGCLAALDLHPFLACRGAS